MTKAFLFSLFLYCLATAAVAQPNIVKSTRVYWFTSLRVGFPLAGDWRGAIDAETRKGWTASVFYFSKSRNSANVPGYFEHYGVFGAGASTSIQEKLKITGLTIGKAWWLGSDRRTRFNLKGGVTYGSLRRPGNFQPTQGLALIFSNYTYEWETRRFAGFVTQPTLEFALLKWVGFSVGGVFHRNEYWNIVGAQASITIGHLRD